MFSLNPYKWLQSKDGPVEDDIESKGISIDPDSFLAYALGANGSSISAGMAAHFYRNTSSVATAVDMIAEAIEQIEPVIEMPDGSFVNDHKIIDLLRKPNGFASWNGFIGQVARNWLLKHDSLISATGNVKREPIEIWPVSLQNISIMQGSDEYPNNYLVSTGPVKGNFIRFDKDRKIGTKFYDGKLKELYHIKGYSSRVAQTEADSPLQAAANEARQIIQGKTHNLQLLKNGGRLSLLVAFKDEGGQVNDDEHRERIQKLNEQFGGPSNAGKIGVISNADIDQIRDMNINNKDMDYGNLEKMAALSIYLRYKIPLALVTTDASTFNNLETGVELLYDNAVLPTLDTLFSGLSFFLLHRFGLDPLRYRLTYNPESIKPLKRRMLDEVKTRRDIGVETINELRSLLPKREPVQDGDTLYQPVNYIPVGQDIFTDDNNDT